MNNRQGFLSSENTNLILQEIIKGLEEYGVQINIKDLQNKIFNFMNQVYQKYPTANLSQLNKFVVDTSVNKYLTNSRVGGQTTFNRNNSIENQFEQELAKRRYQAPEQPPAPPISDRMRPINTQQQKQTTTGGMSLIQAQNGGDDAIEPPPLEEYQPEVEVPIYDQTVTPPVEDNLGRYEEIWLSLNRNDLVNINGNAFTFSWNRKMVPDFKSNFQIQLKYVTLPKNVPYLLAKYGDNSVQKVYSASGKNYGAKLIPCYTSEEYTTYQALGSNSSILDNLPHTLTFHLIPPNSILDLNQISVEKVTKTNDVIRIRTRQAHNLCSQDSLTLEFPQQHTCYKVTNLKIVNENEISLDSPFVGYFSSDFKLLRNNWNLDITLSCQYLRK